MNNYILLYIKESSVHSWVHATLETQVDNNKAFLWRKSTERKWSRDFIWRTAVFTFCRKLSQFSQYCRHPRIFVRGTKKRVDGNPKKVIPNRESVWAAIHGSFIREMLYLNQFRKFSAAKVPKYSIDKVIVCDHTHSPHPRTTWIGMLILATRNHIAVGLLFESPPVCTICENSNALLGGITGENCIIVVPIQGFI